MGLVARGALLAALGLASLAGGGCAARASAAEREISALRSRVAELEAARRRLNGQLKTFDSRLAVLEARGAPRRSRTLPVVRVQPRGAEAPADTGADQGAEPAGFTMAEQGYEPIDEEPDREDDGPRPVLKLHESPAAPASSGGSGTPRKSIDLDNVNERLPVVPMADAPPAGSAPPAGAMPPPFDPEGPASAPVEEVVARARQQARSGQCGEAVNALGAVIANNPEHPLAAEAMLLRARCFRRQGAHLRALGEAERMARRYPSSGLRPAAMLEMAESYASLGDLERARQLFGQVLRRYPRSSAARRATVRVQELGRGARPREER